MMEEMIVKKKALEDIKQIGPTCGFFALAMILNSVERAKIKEYEFVQEIMQLAMENNITNIGEIFNQKSLNDIINIINNNYDVFGVNIIYKLVKFNTEEEFKCKFYDAIKRGKYIMLAYYSNKGKPDIRANRTDMKHIHWGSFYGINIKNNVVMGVEGQKKKKLRCANITDIFLSNQNIGDKFSWRDYYQKNISTVIWGMLTNLDYRFQLIGWSFIPNKRIKKDILRLVLNKMKNKPKKEQKLNDIEIDLKGVFVEIEITCEKKK